MAVREQHIKYNKQTKSLQSKKYSALKTDYLFNMLLRCSPYLQDT